MSKGQKGFTLIELLIVVAIIGIIAAIAIPNLLNAIDRGKQKRTMMDLRTIGVAVETYQVDNSIYPTAATAAILATLLEPSYIRKMPVKDGWGGTFIVDGETTNITIASLGKGGSGATFSCDEGETSTFADDICWVNGRFSRVPVGNQKD